MNADRIEIGDEVEVWFVGGGDIPDRGVVQYTPAATGDAWVIKTDKGGGVVYVCLYARMALVKKGERT